jgi:hypothetical protein
LAHQRLDQPSALSRCRAKLRNASDSAVTDAATIQVNQAIVATTPAVENVITPTPPATRPSPVDMGVVSPSS